MMRLFLGALAIALAGYALLGKGFAYWGLPRFYVAEFVTLAGVAGLLSARRGWAVLRHPVLIVLVLLMGWCLLLTLLDLPTYRFAALRDYATVGYGVLAICCAAAFALEPERVRAMVKGLGRAAPVFALLITPMFVITHTLGESLPHWPGAPVPLVYLKPGDTLVLVALTSAVLLAGLGRWSFWVAGLLWLGFLLPAMTNRAGTLAFAGGMAVLAACLMHRQAFRRRLILALLLLLVIEPVLQVADVQVQRMKHSRPIVQTVAFATVGEIFWNTLTNVGEHTYRQPRVAPARTTKRNGAGQTPPAARPVQRKPAGGVSLEDSLQGTIRWRLNWWKTIVDKTLTREHWWRGRGFGVNLADDDGFQVTADGSLRHPHNIHATYLARAGLPGLGLWLLLQGLWLAAVAGSYWRSRRRRDTQWEALFAVMLAFWTALMINASFDVYLEGPMGALWYWALLGTGVGASMSYNRLSAAGTGPLAAVPAESGQNGHEARPQRQ